MNLNVSLNKITYCLFYHEDAFLPTTHTPFDIVDILFFEPYMFCNQQCLVDFSHQLHTCVVTSQFIKCIASTISRVDDFCTVLNVPLHKVTADSSSSSDYHKAVRMFREWQSQSEGTYQCLRQHMDQYSVFSGRNILVCTHLLCMCT